MIQNQLGINVPLIMEPERRDTFPAIALAASYLYSIKGTSLNEVVGILPVDPYVDISFFERIKDLEGVLNNSDADCINGCKSNLSFRKVWLYSSITK
jgi:mannose-1-phosphate guanylyltransferase